MNGDAPKTLESLTERVDGLEKRLEVLEHALAHDPGSSAKTSEPTQPAVLDTYSGEQTVVAGSGLLLLTGRSLLGIAGAYMLRAISESAAASRTLIGIVAGIYAAGWLLAGARAMSQWKHAPASYALTSMLILSPMLWEMTLRFHAFSAITALGILATFAVIANSPLNKQRGVVAITNIGVASTALALSVATHEMLAFTVLLIALFAWSEFGELSSRSSGARPLIVLVADLDIWAMLAIYRLPEKVRTDYPILRPESVLLLACFLFGIGAATLAVRLRAQGARISILEIAQNMIALTLVGLGIYWFFPQARSTVLGVICLILAVPCYAVGFGIFRRANDVRNFYVFGTWSAGLLCAGLFLIETASWASATLAFAGASAIWIAIRLRCELLELQGVAFLITAAATSGLLGYAGRALAGPMPTHLPWGIAVSAACILISYLTDNEKPDELWDRQILHFIPALLSACALMGVLVHGAVAFLTVVFTPAVFHVAFIRTFAICGVALLLAFCGARWKRREMTRVAYLAMGFVIIKLLFEDLRHGHLAFTAASIALVALTLILVPRLKQLEHRT